MSDEKVEAIDENPELTQQKVKKLKRGEVMSVLKQMAEILPQKMLVRELRKVKGIDLVRDGHKEVHGRPIDIKESYTVYKNIQKKFNHMKRLRKSFDDHGAMGVFVYGLQIFKQEFWEEWRLIVMDLLHADLPPLKKDPVEEKKEMLEVVSVGKEKEEEG